MDKQPLVVLVLTLVTSLLLSGCGGDEPAPETGNSGTETGSKPKEPAAKEKPEPEPEPEPVIRAPAVEPGASGKIIASEVDASAPADLTGTTFVTGEANTYVGGVSTNTGTGTVPVMERTSLARPVQLSGREWRCDWPASALAQDIYENFVVLRVLVDADGSVENAEVLQDPGHGFGDAAMGCALRTKFSPARNALGEPIRATSSPIRVRFTR